MGSLPSVGGLDGWFGVVLGRFRGFLGNLTCFVASFVASLLLPNLTLSERALPDESAFLKHRGGAACGEFLPPNFQTRHRFLAALGSFTLFFQ
jgi:hypothetical protein